MPADTLIFDTAQAVLDAVAAGLTSEVGIEPPYAPPARRFVADGEVADDLGEGCEEQLTVQVLSIFTGTTEGGSGDLGVSSPWVAEMQVRLVRCAPPMGDKGQAPSATAISASAEQLLTEVWRAIQGVRDAYASGDLPGCQGVRFGTVAGVGPLGGVVGWTMGLRVAI